MSEIHSPPYCRHAGLDPAFLPLEGLLAQVPDKCSAFSGMT